MPWWHQLLHELLMFAIRQSQLALVVAQNQLQQHTSYVVSEMYTINQQSFEWLASCLDSHSTLRLAWEEVTLLSICKHGLTFSVVLSNTQTWYFCYNNSHINCSSIHSFHNTADCCIDEVRHFCWWSWPRNNPKQCTAIQDYYLWKLPVLHSTHHLQLGL